MKILAFDTSNNTSSVAISEDQNILSYIEELRPSMQAECIIDMIEIALLEAGCTYNEIDYLAVTRGPGSFTGIRIGLATAKAIALATNINSTAISNFEIAHFRASKQIKNCDKFIIFINAYRGQLYAQNFDKNSAIGLPILIDSNEAIKLLKKENTEIACAGSGVEIIYSQIKHLTNLTILPRFPKIKAIDLCKYVGDKIPNLLLRPIEPLYIRPVDAKISKSH